MMGHPDIDRDVIENFIGYGSIDAPIVFVGIEERLSDFEQRLPSLGVRSAFDPVMDVVEAHAAGLAHDPRLFDAANVICQRTWRPMCDLMLRYDIRRCIPDGIARNQYQANHLGRHERNSLLIELLPYPHRSTRDWWYEDLRPECHDRAQYENLMIPLRIPLLSEQIALHPRQLIICYGASHWDSFRTLIGQYRHIYLGHQAAAIEWQIHQDLGFAESAIIGETRVVLVNHFTRPPLSTDRALGPFAALCLAPI